MTLHRNPHKKRSRRKGLLRWLAGLSGLGIIGFAVFYQWQPWEFDWIMRLAPRENPWTSPEPERLFSKGTKVVLITAHPDDSEFYLGGSLSRLAQTGAEMTLIVVTSGDKAYYPFVDAEKNRQIRYEEQLAAAKAWSAREVIYLNYPDGRLKFNDQLVNEIADNLSQIQPEYILIFDGAYPPRLSHQDHRRAGEAAEKAIIKAKVGKWLMRFQTDAPNFAIDVTQEWDNKFRLLRFHKSQFMESKLERLKGIIESPAIRDGKLIGTKYAEGFRCQRLRF